MFDHFYGNKQFQYWLEKTREILGQEFFELFVLRVLAASITVVIPVRFLIFPMLASGIFTEKGIYPTALILGLLFIFLTSGLILLIMIFILQALIGRDRRWLSFFGVLAGIALGINFLG